MNFTPVSLKNFKLFSVSFHRKTNFTMNEKKAKQIKQFLDRGILPKEYSSTKPNFIALAGKYNLNKKKVLLRDNKIVVTKKMQLEIYNALHQHSGRTTTWERIKSR